NHGIVDASQGPADAGNANGVRAGAADPPPHAVDEVLHFDDLWFPGRVADDGFAFGDGRGHHDVFRGAHARQVKVNLVANQFGSPAVDKAVPLFDGRTQRSESCKVEVDGP